MENIKTDSSFEVQCRRSLPELPHAGVSARTLHVEQRGVIDLGQRSTVSRWRPTKEELEALVNGGSIEVSLFADVPQHPLIHVEVAK